MVNKTKLNIELKKGSFGARSRIALARADIRDFKRSKQDNIITPLEKKIRTTKFKNLFKSANLTPTQKAKARRTIRAKLKKK